jgi:hypothetical protein
MKAVNKHATRCLRDISRGKVIDFFPPCLFGDGAEKPAERTEKTNQKKCRDKELTTPPTYGWIDDPTAVNDAALLFARSTHLELLGNPSFVVASAQKDVSRCQQEIQKGMARYLDALSVASNKSKKTGLAGKKIDPVETPTQLAAALALGKESDKATKSEAKWRSRVEKKCETIDPGLIDLIFPGACDSAPSFEALVDCAKRRVLCNYCQMIRAADGIPIGCDAYDDGLSNASCP